MKKLMSFVVAFAMLFSLAIPSFGADADSAQNESGVRSASPVVTIEAAWYDIYGSETDGGMIPAYTNDFVLGSQVLGSTEEVTFEAEDVEGFSLAAIRINGEYVNEIDFIAESGEIYDILFIYAEEVTEVPALKDSFDFNIGAAVSRGFFTNGSMMNHLLMKHFNTITATNEMKPESYLGRNATIGTDGWPVLDFTAGDVYADYAKENGLALHGHTLLWHSQTPSWFFRTNYTATGARVSREVMLERMEWYIKEILTHYETNYPGVIYAWDVVNEAAGENNGGMRGQPGQGTSDWYTIIGSDYVAKAFEFAKKYAGPDTLLLYNDYAINGHEKRQSAMEFLMPILEAGNIGGIGEQAHHHINNSVAGDEETYRIFGEEFGFLDITELDCLNTTRDAAGALKQATWYHDFFESLKAIKEDGVDLGNVIFWGIGDNDSWKRADLPLLFGGANYDPKPAFWAVTGVEGPGASVEERVAIIYAGTPGADKFWDGFSSYPIGRLGTYKAVFDKDSIYFLIEAEAGSKVELALDGKIYIDVIGDDGTLELAVPNTGDAKFDIGVVTDGKADAWNSYFYKGYNLGNQNYQGKLQLATGEARAIKYTGSLDAGSVDPTLDIELADARFNFQTRTEGMIDGELFNSNMVLENGPLGWNVDTGTTGLTLVSITTNSGRTRLKFSGITSPGTLSISANASSFGQTAQGIKTSNVLEITCVSNDPSVTLRGDAGAVQGEDAKYLLSVANMSKLATATFWFEVEDAYFTGKSFTGLNGFELLDTVQWVQDGDKWIGRATLANMDGGVSTLQPLDIFEMVYTAKEELGTTEVKLTKILLSGYNDQNEAVYLEAGILNDTVSVTIGEFFSKYDVNRDKVVNQLDLTTAQLYYMAEKGDANWNIAQKSDVNDDGKVDIADFVLILGNIVW